MFTASDTVQGILSVPNNTNQFLVVTANKIYGITNTSANGVASYTQNFVTSVSSGQQIAYGRYSPNGTLFVCKYICIKKCMERIKKVSIQENEF